MVYSWKDYKYAISADTVGKQFEEIEKRYGSVTSENVLNTAKDTKNPIHSLCEWDDSVAANNYRLQQASKIICNLSVELETKEHQIITRAYVDVSENKKGSFINVVSAFENQDTKAIVLQRALQELITFKNKYKNLNELSMVISSIDKFIEKAN